MGNSGSGNRRSGDEEKELPYKTELQTLFKNLLDYGVLKKDAIQKHFQGPCEDLVDNLYNRYYIDLINGDSVTQNIFVERSQKILSVADESKRDQAHFYLDFLLKKNKEITSDEVQRVFSLLLQYALIWQPDYEPRGDKENGDETDDVINSFVDSCMQGKDVVTKDDIIAWVLENNECMFDGFQAWLYHKFTGCMPKLNHEILPQPLECAEDNLLLSRSLLWYLCCVLPTIFTKVDKDRAGRDENGEEPELQLVRTWNLIYDSNQHGLSLNRFKNKVMNYKGPTVTVFHFANNVSAVAAIDQPWVDSPDRFGGPYCHLIQISPQLKILDASDKMAYLKELGRAIPTGMQFGSQREACIKIDTDLESATLVYMGMCSTTVLKLEVWGCGGSEAMRSQKDMRKWEKNEIEKRKKVKLPGQWDTDKTILEMGGVCVNHSQRGDM